MPRLFAPPLLCLLLLFHIVATCRAGEVWQVLYGNNCAVDAIHLCLRAKGHTQQYQEVMKLCADGRSASSTINLLKIVEVLKHYGVNARGVKMDTTQLKKHRGNLLVVTKGNGITSHVFFARVEDDHITAFDPQASAKPKIMTYDELASTWLGAAILCD